MTTSQSNPATDQRPDPFRWPRADATQAAHDFANPDLGRPSQRHFAQQTGIPRSTLQHWLQRQQHPDLDPTFVAFCESPAGHRFLRRLTLALHFVFHLGGPAGLRLISRFLQLTQLDRFVGASYGTQQALAVHLQEQLATYAQSQQQRLAASMPPKTISACLDENFHGQQPCLVAIEPTSNFLLLEAYHPQRDGATWTAALKQALQGLPVEVVQVTSDQAKGLLACAHDGLEAQHSPDLFHGQRDLSRAVAGPLARQTATAVKEADQARGRTAQVQEQIQEYAAGPRPAGRPPDLAGRLAFVQNWESYTATKAQACQDRQDQAREAVRGLADDYHPFDASTGRPQTATAIEGRLNKRVEAVATVAQAAGLGEASSAALAKVRRWLVPLLATVGWFWEMVGELLNELELTPEQRRVVREQLLPGLYWQREATRGRDAEQKQQRRALAERLLAEAWSAQGPLGGLAAQRREKIERVGGEAVDLFVRSSSCVEGRNGQLALYHHGHGPLSELRLRALTAVHNYVVERADGTTAAERFFGSKPDSAFEWLLERLPELPRPGRKGAAARNTAATVD